MLMRGHEGDALCEICNERPGVRIVRAIGMEAWTCAYCAGDEVEESLPADPKPSTSAVTAQRVGNEGQPRRAIGRRVAEFDELRDALHYSRIHGREYSVIGGIDKPWAVGRWITLTDDEIRAVVKPPAPGPHAISNAAQAAIWVESDREHT